jgi:hypothetical protein
MQLPSLEKLTPRELEVLTASAARNVQVGYGSGLTSEDILDDQAKRLHKALPRRSRKTVEELARAYVEGPRLSYTRFADELVRTFLRVAAVLSDDLPECVQVMQRLERDISGLSGPDLVVASPTVSDLMRFWLSETALNLRRRSGLIG